MAKKRMLSMPNMSDVESYGLLPEASYHVKVVKVEEKEGPKGPYLNWELEVVSGEHKGSKVWNITSLTDKSLWILKQWLEALEADVPEEAEEVAAEDYEGLELRITVKHDEYEGKKRPKISDFEALSGDSAEDVEVEDETEDGKKEKFSVDQIKDMDDDELKDLVKEHGLDVKLKKLKTAKKRVNAVIAACEEEDLLEQDDD